MTPHYDDENPGQWSSIANDPRPSTIVAPGQTGGLLHVHTWFKGRMVDFEAGTSNHLNVGECFCMPSGDWWIGCLGLLNDFGLTKEFRRYDHPIQFSGPLCYDEDLDHWVRIVSREARDYRDEPYDQKYPQRYKKVWKRDPHGESPDTYHEELLEAPYVPPATWDPGEDNYIPIAPQDEEPFDDPATNDVDISDV